MTMGHGPMGRRRRKISEPPTPWANSPVSEEEPEATSPKASSGTAEASGSREV